MVSSTSAYFRRAVQRLISSSITALIDVSFARLHLSRFSLGHYTGARGGERAARRVERYVLVTGQSALRYRIAVDGMLAPAGERHRLCASRNRGSPRQGRQGSTHDDARKSGSTAARTVSRSEAFARTRPAIGLGHGG